MPFAKVGKNKFASPSGNKFTLKQVRKYYATKGTFHSNPSDIKKSKKAK